MENNRQQDNRQEKMENQVSVEQIIAQEAARQEELENKLLSKKYAILDRVQERAKRFGVAVPQEVLDQIGRLAMSVKGGVAVTTRKVAHPSVAECGDMLIEYQLEEADDEKTARPYLLSLWFTKLEKDSKKSLKAVRLEKWLLGKGIPFVPELMQHLDENEDVTVHVFRYVRDFALAVAKIDFSDDNFVGQKVKNRMFDKDNAVGIVKDNVVNIYAPAWMFNKSTWTFYVR